MHILFPWPYWMSVTSQHYISSVGKQYSHLTLPLCYCDPREAQENIQYIPMPCSLLSWIHRIQSQVPQPFLGLPRLKHGRTISSWSAGFLNHKNAWMVCWTRTTSLSSSWPASLSWMVLSGDVNHMASISLSFQNLDSSDWLRRLTMISGTRVSSQSRPVCSCTSGGQCLLKMSNGLSILVMHIKLTKWRKSTFLQWCCSFLDYFTRPT